MYICYALELAYVFYVYMINIEITGKHMTVVGRFVLTHTYKHWISNKEPVLWAEI